LHIVFQQVFQGHPATRTCIWRLSVNKPKNQSLSNA